MTTGRINQVAFLSDIANYTNPHAFRLGICVAPVLSSVSRDCFERSEAKDPLTHVVFRIREY